MHRTHFLSLLAAYQPDAPEELTSKKLIQSFVENNPECFERSLSTGHITASAWLLNKDGSCALLMHHKKLELWVQLGGHCDGDSDVLAVAIKEAQEESGILHISPLSTDIFDIDIHLIPANTREAEHYHYDIRFLLQVTSNEPCIQNNESNELRWIDKNRHSLPTHEPSVMRMFQKWCLLS